MGRNAGFAAAVNRGIRGGAPEWIAVLNSDVELAPDYFAKLLAGALGQKAEFRGLPAAWFATGKILDARRNGLLDGTFDLTCRGGTAWRVGSGRPDGRTVLRAATDLLAALDRGPVPRRTLPPRGLLEERFESYLEDVDFGLRCAARGLAGWYVPEAVAWHRGSASLGRWHPETVRRIARNQLLLVARHYPARCAWLADPGRPRCCGAGWRCATARRGLAARRGQGLRGFCARAPRVLPRDPDVARPPARQTSS